MWTDIIGTGQVWEAAGSCMSEQIYLSLYILGSLLSSEKGIAVKACLWLRDCLMTGLDTVLGLGLKKV